jgi:chromosome segregation ATPase
MKPIQLCLAFVLCLLLAGPASAEFYKYVAEDGTVHFTDDINDVPADQRAGIAGYAESEGKTDLVEEQSQAEDQVGEESSDENSIDEALSILEEKGSADNEDADKVRARLEQMKADIDKRHEGLQKEKTAIETERQKVKTREEIMKYNKRVEELNQRIAEYETKGREYQAQVDAYNAKVLKQKPAPKSE